MQAERRLENKRIEANKALEFIVDGQEIGCFGYTDNLSDTGIRAHMTSEPPPRGANVLVRLYWEEGDPIEQKGQIVWTAPGLVEGGVDVGLCMRDLPEDEENGAASVDLIAPQIAPQIPPQNQIYCEGSTITVSTGGIPQECVISSIGEPLEDGVIVVRARMANDEVLASPAQDAAPLDSFLGKEDELDAVDWTPHPFKDGWNLTRKYVGPVIRTVCWAGKKGGIGLGQLAGQLWTRFRPAAG